MEAGGAAGAPGAGVMAGVTPVVGVPIDAEELADILAAEIDRRLLSSTRQRVDHLARIEHRARVIADSGKTVLDTSPLEGWLPLTRWCERVGAHDRTGRSWAVRGVIEARKVGKSWWVPADELPPDRRGRN